ncbi:MAG: FAD-binding oxidoreductase, partial [Burkholderiaceae bacterium]
LGPDDIRHALRPLRRTHARLTMKAVFPDPALTEALRQIAGEQGLVCDEARLARYNTPSWGAERGGARLVLRPASTAEVSACVRLCAQHRVGIVPYGGGTGFVGGQLAAPDGSEIVMVMERMASVRLMDAASRCVVVDAGMVVADIRSQAQKHGLSFPLTFGADGSAQIGGALATNAGGMNALRYGVARDLCLGLEVVLPSGEILDQLSSVRKDNTGYDLKQLFIGSEGTLGIITGAALKLVPEPAAVACALVGLEDAAAAVTLLGRLSERSDQRLCLFELMLQDAITLATKWVPGCRSPFADTPPAMALVELEGSDGAQLHAVLEAVLAQAMDEGLVVDALVASSEAQRASFRRLREALPVATGRAGWVASHDICLPISRVPDYLARLQQSIEALSGAHRAIIYGHLGDGNLHVNIVHWHPPSAQDDAALRDALSEAVLSHTMTLGGSVSAEHGIGLEKVDLLQRTEPRVALAMMRGIKDMLDPLGIMNPGKVLGSHTMPRASGQSLQVDCASACS